MADFAHVPHTMHEIERDGPFTLTDYFEDGTPVHRQKSATVKRIWTARYRGETLAITKAMLDFFELKGFSTSFTIITWDPSETGPSTAEAAVYLLKPLPTTVESHSGYYEFEVRFREA